MQGIIGLDDAALAELRPWLRLAPAVCSALIAVATFLGQPIALWVLMPLGLICATFGTHPVNMLYNIGLRHLFGTRRIPRSGAPVRFSCLVAALWLGGTGIAFVGGVPLLGYALGTALVLATGVAATTSFCPGCFIYERLKRGAAT
jgi:low affinity Fe/Cu permease